MEDKNKDLLELVDLILDASQDAMKVAKDPGNYAQDTSILLALIPEIQAGFSGIGNVPAELSSLSAEDAASLVAHVSAKLTIADAHAELIIDAALKGAAAVYGLIKAIVEKPAVVPA